MQSLQSLEDLWTRKPGHRGYARYARALVREGRLEEASKVLTEGIQKWPHDVTAHLLLAEIAHQHGDLAQSRAQLEEALKEDPHTPSLLFNLAAVLSEQQYYLLAKERLERCLIVMPDDENAGNMLVSVKAKLQEESSRVTSSAPIAESPADLVEGTFKQEGTVSMAALPGLDPSAAPEALLPAEMPAGSLASLDMPSFHDQSLGGSAKDAFSAADDDASVPAPDAPADQPASPAAGADFGATDPTLPAFDVPAALQTPDLAFPSPVAAAGLETFGAALSGAGVAAAGASVLGTGASLGLGVERDDDPFGLNLGHTGSVPAAPEMPAPLMEEQPAAAAPAAAGGDVTGEDLANRLDELFKDEDPVSSATAPMPAVPPLSSEEEVADSVTGEDVADRLDDIFPASTLPEMPVVPPVSAPAEPVTPVAGSLPAVPKSAIPLSNVDEPVVQGNDVEQRLDELFAEDKATSAEPRPEEDFDATLQLPAAESIDPEELMRTQHVERATEDSPDSETGTDTRLESRELLEEQEKERETAAAEVEALPNSDSWQPGSLVNSHSSDVDSQLDELFAASSFPKDALPPVMAVPPPVPPVVSPVPTALPTPSAPPSGITAPDLGATTSFARNEVTGNDVGDRLEELFGSDSEMPVSDLSAPPPAPSAPVAGVPTVTLAEEYARQGHREQAMSVYRELLQRDPTNESYRTRLAELQAMEH